MICTISTLGKIITFSTFEKGRQRCFRGSKIAARYFSSLCRSSSSFARRWDEDIASLLLSIYATESEAGTYFIAERIFHRDFNFKGAQSCFLSPELIMILLYINYR